jgi:HEAT repeat protein/cyclophilin family peptidyl-prolyl cis-trans isomerase
MPVASPAGRRLPLEDRDINTIARLLLLEDRRQFDDRTLGIAAQSLHPEVRRRAYQAIARIPNVGGRALLARARSERDSALFATVVWATGQIYDSTAVAWLDTVMRSPQSPPTAAVEAARALGKIRTAEAHAALAAFLNNAQVESPVVGEALLSMGRMPEQRDLDPVKRWTGARDPEVRWRAAWALFRKRNPAAVEPLLALATDRSPDVRFWAVRGLARVLVDSAGIDRGRVSALLIRAVNDDDRRVRTEALRTLGPYDDDASIATLVNALTATDTWLSVSAAEMLGPHAARAEQIVPALVAAAAPGKPIALRITAITALSALRPPAAIEAATMLSQDTVAFARAQAIAALNRLGDPGRARADSLIARDSSLARRVSNQQRGEVPPRTPEDYRRLVERWIIPEYNGAPRPRVIWETNRGTVEMELYPGDAPMGVEHMLRVIETGDIIGTEFTRLVPNFVAQQRAIRSDIVLRDEVNRFGLTRGNLSWASSGLDTGRPGFTLGNTPQPHNEGGFTALGRVVRGMDVVDRFELGDRITAARATIQPR